MVNPICRSDVCNILFRINKALLLLIATEWTLRGLQRLVNKEEIQIFLWGFILCYTLYQNAKNISWLSSRKRKGSHGPIFQSHQGSKL